MCYTGGGVSKTSTHQLYYQCLHTSGTPPHLQHKKQHNTASHPPSSITFFVSYPHITLNMIAMLKYTGTRHYKTLQDTHCNALQGYNRLQCTTRVQDNTMTFFCPIPYACSGVTRYMSVRQVTV